MRQILEKYLDKITDIEAEDLRRSLQKIVVTSEYHFKVISKIEVDSSLKRSLMSIDELISYNQSLRALKNVAPVTCGDDRIHLGELLLNEYKSGKVQFVIKGISA